MQNENSNFTTLIVTIVVTAIISAGVTYVLMSPNEADQSVVDLQNTKKKEAKKVTRKSSASVQYMDQNEVIPLDANRINRNTEDTDLDSSLVNHKTQEFDEVDPVEVYIPPSPLKKKYHSLLTKKVLARRELRVQAGNDLEQYETLVKQWKIDNADLLAEIDSLKVQVQEEDNLNDLTE